MSSVPFPNLEEILSTKSQILIRIILLLVIIGIYRTDKLKKTGIKISLALRFCVRNRKYLQVIQKFEIILFW